jgi:hypothetical protein
MSDVFRISKKISSEEQPDVKVLPSTKKPVKTLLLNVESPYKSVNFFRVLGCWAKELCDQFWCQADDF